jgi:hypothetical protein
MHQSLYYPLLFIFGLQLVSAQFQFFENMFSQQQHHHQQQQQQQRSGASQWAAYSDSGQCLCHFFFQNRVTDRVVSLLAVLCSQYLCPGTLDCVKRPVDCPCPNPEDIKCTIPDTEGEDATVVCIRGQNECAEVERLMKKGFETRK